MRVRRLLALLTKITSPVRSRSWYTPGPRGARSGETELAHRRVVAQLREREQIVQCEHAEGARAEVEQGVEDLCGGLGIGERPVARLDLCAEALRQGPQAQVGEVAAQEAVAIYPGPFCH